MADALFITFNNSLERCMAGGGFLAAFYRRFLAKDPEIEAKFAHTDFNKQVDVLKNSLIMILMMRTHADVPEYEGMLEQVAVRHNRNNLDIPPHLYVVWFETLLETVKVHDAEFDEQVQMAWQDVLRHGIKFMVDRY